MAAKTLAQKAAEDLVAGAAKDAVTVPTAETDQGGATVQEVIVEVIEPQAGSAFTMEVVTTAIGTFGIGGIAQIGSKAKIDCSAFSTVWMQPRTKADVAALKAYRASLEKDDTA
jgi:hypothetical protein